jgi:activator of HSP90 ATPase
VNPAQSTRRNFSFRLATILPITALAPSALGQDGRDHLGITHTSESIHQEVVFKASRKRIYEALTDEKRFKQVTDFVMKGASTRIGREVGETFSLFDGVILGRHIEMAPDEDLVQAWREKDWDPGIYSIVRFQLNEQGSDTKLVFDHTGFPRGAAVHLAPGWWSHYWEPLQKYLG